MPNGRYRTTDTPQLRRARHHRRDHQEFQRRRGEDRARCSTTTFYGYLRKLGYGRAPAAASPAKRLGLLPSPHRWSGTTKQTMSYGYGLTATPLQIAQAYAALGNGGKLIAPTFVKGQRNEARQAMDPVVAHEVCA